jgi:glycosyltransferase involved in cell wall biosynthesis
LIRDGDNGHLFPAGSSEALARCLMDVLQTPATWSVMVARGRDFVERERTWKASVARYRAVYDRALGGARHLREQTA